MTKVKICGITNFEDALVAVDLGADILGFNFYPKSVRYISPGEAKVIIEKLEGKVETAGVFVNEVLDHVLGIAVKTMIDIVQFHGDETARDAELIRNELGIDVVKAVRTERQFEDAFLDEFVDVAFLIDGFSPNEYGGTGILADSNIARSLVEKGRTLYLAGGLNYKNVAEAIRAVRPYAVDVASGVESSPGKKDHKKMAAFIENAKSAI